MLGTLTRDRSRCCKPHGYPASIARPARGAQMNLEQQERPLESRDAPAPYERPAIVDLGALTELTREKTVGAADGVTFLGLDVGSI
jgi:hypothetical protein